MVMTTSPDRSSEQVKPVKSSRHLARQLTLQMLFQQEFHLQDAMWREKFLANQSVSDDTQRFAISLLEGVLAHQSDIDRLIQTFAVGWSIERMPLVDRNILRCAIYELLWEPEIPAAVTINEAVELSKQFADEEAQRFVNGVLDHIVREETRLQAKRLQMPGPPVTVDTPKPTS